MNPLITRFLLKGLAFFSAWYIIYELIVLPDGRLDTWMSVNIIEISAGIVSLMGFDVISAGRIAAIGASTGIELVNGCNGIAAMGLFLGFMYAWPEDWGVKGMYALLSILVLYLVNILRIVVLMITQVYWPDFFHFTHDYSTTALFYMVIFGLWMLWTEKGSDWEKLRAQV